VDIKMAQKIERKRYGKQRIKRYLHSQLNHGKCGRLERSCWEWGEKLDKGKKSTVGMYAHCLRGFFFKSNSWEDPSIEKFVAFPVGRDMSTGNYGQLQSLAVLLMK
jgi:hypothetical protein